jgi:hypothetical protein
LRRLCNRLQLRKLECFVRVQGSGEKAIQLVKMILQCLVLRRDMILKRVTSFGCLGAGLLCGLSRSSCIGAVDPSSFSDDCSQGRFSPGIMSPTVGTPQLEVTGAGRGAKEYARFATFPAGENPDITLTGLAVEAADSRACLFQ